MKGISFLCVSFAGLSLIAGQIEVSPLDVCKSLLKFTCTPLQAFVVSYLISVPAENKESKKCMVIETAEACNKDADCAWCQVSETDGQCLTKALHTTGCNQASKTFMGLFTQEIVSMDKDVKVLSAADVAKCTVNTDNAACDAAANCETCELMKDYNAPIICLPSTYAALKANEKKMCELINNNPEVPAAVDGVTPGAVGDDQIKGDGGDKNSSTPNPATTTPAPANSASYAAYTTLGALSLLLGFMVL